MWWLFIGLIVLIAAFAIPNFGKAIVGFIGLIIAIGLIWYLYEENEEKLSKSRISPNEIELTDLLLHPGYGAGSYTLKGRIKNNSPQYTLSGIRVKIAMKDCIKPGECEVVGEAIARDYNDIPSGQTRTLDDSVYFSALPKPRGKYEWSYTITEITGK